MEARVARENHETHDIMAVGMFLESGDDVEERKAFVLALWGLA